MVWVVLWAARAGPKSLDVHRLPCISMVWAVLGGAGGPRIIENAKSFMHFHALNLYRTTVRGAVGRRIIGSIEFHAFPRCGWWCGVRGRPQNHWKCMEFHNYVPLVWVVLWGARVAPESMEIQRIQSISMVWVVV